MRGCAACMLIMTNISQSIVRLNAQSNLPSPILKPTKKPVVSPLTPPTKIPTTKPSNSLIKPTKVPTALSKGPTKLPTTKFPTKVPTKIPTKIPTSALSTDLITPTRVPTKKPTGPTSKPTPNPTDIPVKKKTPKPSKKLTESPTSIPTNATTTKPTKSPTGPPTSGPFLVPTSSPIESPTFKPSFTPQSESPTLPQPTENPSPSPTISLSENPTSKPTFSTTLSPTSPSSESPTIIPTDTPNSPPNKSPTLKPAASPTLPPTPSPSKSPTLKPNTTPTLPPTPPPSKSPTLKSNTTPTLSPTPPPSKSPTLKPISFPTPPPTPPPINSPTTLPSTPQPSKSPISQPVSSTTLPPTSHPSKSPTVQPSPLPTLPSTSSPTLSPTSLPSTSPTLQPTSSPTLSPTSQPSTSPTLQPTSSPTLSPTSQPSTSPTFQPTSSPTISPTFPPSMNPTIQPTDTPTLPPISPPSEAPTLTPTETPTNSPTSEIPTSHQSGSPTSAPTAPSNDSTQQPTENPTPSPTLPPNDTPLTENPNLQPTESPTTSPTLSPNENPILQPTESPTTSPTLPPNENPTLQPTESPTTSPTLPPSQNPTLQPTENPTTSPTLPPSQNPTLQPTESPTTSPTLPPSQNPTLQPTESPTLQPNEAPTSSPTLPPSESPTSLPTLSPTLAPTSSPTDVPSPLPTSTLTSPPSSQPTPRPTHEFTRSETTESPILTFSPTSPPNSNFATLFNCPIPQNSINFTSNGLVAFSIPSSSQSLCTLHQFSSENNRMKPIARSYAGNEWEASGGEFSTLAWSCSGVVCSVKLPILPDNSHYVLTSFYPPETFRNDGMDEIARFLEQATFGAPKADFAYFDASKLSKSFADWIKEQQEAIPLTSHRAFFRKRTNARMETATRNAAVTHPCEKGTTYRRYAFSMKDNYKYVTLTTNGTKVIMKVDGFVRTVVNGPISRLFFPDIIWPDGSHQYFRSLVNDKIGGDFFLYLPSAKGFATVTMNGVRGNPTIQFDPSIGAQPNILIDLDPSDVIPHDTKYFTKASVNLQEIKLTRDLSYEICDSINEPGNPINPVFAFYDNSYWIHDPRFDTITNTLESPSPDGGGNSVRETQNIVQFDLSAACANVERTFLNEDTCILSNEPTACASGTYDANGGLNRPDFFVVLNDENIRGIYKATGNGTDATRYLYAVDGLRASDDKTIAKPCDRAWSRWIPINCTGDELKQDPTIQEIFSQLLYYASNKNNIYLRDIYNSYATPCPSLHSKSTGFEVRDLNGVQCWKNVHPDHLSVYDMTFWTKLSSHPGNSIDRNPIKEFAINGSTSLMFPAWHSMNYWSDNKGVMGLYVGRYGDQVHYYDFPNALRSQTLNEYFGFFPQSINYTDSKGILVCGSPNEIENDLSLGGSQGRGAFDIYNQNFVATEALDTIKQKRIVWTHVILTAKDQLRQRIAWALSQILAVSPAAIIDGEFNTEGMTAFYDIFVRNAFGSYRDILKEISYNSLMAEMLTYYRSISTAFTWKQSRKVQYADENFAREIMQLFTIGNYKLKEDGNFILDEQGLPIKAYTNDEIVEYARAWTGFYSRSHRGNVENYYWNHIDPMKIMIEYRDILPKMGLDRKYVGDGYPLCADQPEKLFLKSGATYRLLGSSSLPELKSDPSKWASDPLTKRLRLQSNGPDSLFAKLCGSEDPNLCNFKVKIVLDRNLACSGNECSVETLRVVEVVPGIFYEYIRLPCVYQAYYENAKTIWKRTNFVEIVCADPRTIQASVACCDSTNTSWNEIYWGERTTFASAQQRCNQQLCTRGKRPSCDTKIDPNVGTLCANDAYFWTNTPCTLQVKINTDGTIAIVHSLARNEPDAMMRHVHNDTKTFFRADWSSEGFQSIVSNCNSIPACAISVDSMCVCNVTTAEEQVYYQGDNPTVEAILTNLRIGAYDPSLSSIEWTVLSYGDVKVYSVNGLIASTSIFEVTDTNGVRHFRKNMKSKVQILGTSSSFRNPVHFISLSDPALHQAQDETDAVLDHYFYHPNTAPFLALRFAQRFGISNPSPGFITRIGRAFKLGTYSFSVGESSVTFGNGKYGNLGAMIACVLLDRESRTTILDADPSHGSLKEPLIKVMSLMRSLEFGVYNDAGFVDFDIAMSAKIGQMAHDLPSVFSFFSPTYTSGIIGEASLVAPEAQVMTGPRTIDFLNGLLSLIKFGLSSCYGGLGRYHFWIQYDCTKYSLAGVNDGSMGSLAYSNQGVSEIQKITDDLATLLTSGRLSRTSRDMVDEVIRLEPNRTIGLLKAQQLIVTSPEFHATNTVRLSGAERPDPIVPVPSSKPYKAVVHIFLDGGMDSFNMVIPHTCSQTNSLGQTLLQQYISERTLLAIESYERTRVINAVGQPCSQFVVNKDLEIVERLYKLGDLSFFLNVGVLNQPVNPQNYGITTKTALFGHNTMQEEAQRIDPYEKAPGTGMLGRMCDTLKQNGYNVQAITIQDASIATVGSPGTGLEPLIVSASETTKFNPLSPKETFIVKPYLKRLNDATELQSSLYGELWSQNLQKAIFDNEAILNTLASSKLNVAFPNTDYGAKLKVVASLISTQKKRGNDRDVFYLTMGSWDHHSELKIGLSANFIKLNDALTSFYNEMVAQGVWNGVTVVVTSEFSRTLTANSGKGSDHGWGGNYFMMGGSVKGGQFHGAYPSDITPGGPLNIGRGRLIPTLSWESMMNPVIQWMGLTTDTDLDYSMPNRIKAGAPLLNANDVFEL